VDGVWIEVKVITKSEALEPISGIFYSMDVKGVAIEDPQDILQREQGPLTWDFADLNILEYGGKAAVVKAYFHQDEDEEKIVETIKNKINELKEFGIDVGEGKVLSVVVKEEDWANNWKKYYKPTRIGKNMIIKPEWEHYDAKDTDLIIEMDPGMAFGTGTHETTRMCIAALEKYINKNTTVFDIGTGSGILAIAAAKLGAKEVIGVDIDPVAVDSAKANTKLNNLDNIEILQGDLMEVVDGKAEVIVANIIAEIIIFLTDSIVKSLVKDGIFICSGIIKDKRISVEEKLKNSNFEILESNIDGEWVCIVAKYNG
jgi:ribosomal protein L11 methyltransferase